MMDKKKKEKPKDDRISSNSQWLYKQERYIANKQKYTIQRTCRVVHKNIQQRNKIKMLSFVLHLLASSTLQPSSLHLALSKTNFFSQRPPDIRRKKKYFICYYTTTTTTICNNLNPKYILHQRTDSHSLSYLGCLFELITGRDRVNNYLSSLLHKQRYYNYFYYLSAASDFRSFFFSSSSFLLLRWCV